MRSLALCNRSTGHEAISYMGNPGWELSFHCGWRETVLIFCILDISPIVAFPTEGNSLLQNFSTAIPVPMAESPTASPSTLPPLAHAILAETITQPPWCPMRCHCAAQQCVSANWMAPLWPVHPLRLLKHGFMSVMLPWALTAWGSASVLPGGSVSSFPCRAVIEALSSVPAEEARMQEL